MRYNLRATRNLSYRWAPKGHFEVPPHSLIARLSHTYSWPLEDDPSRRLCYGTYLTPFGVMWYVNIFHDR